MAAARRLERSRLVMTRSHDPNGPATIPTARRRPKADVLELGGRKLKPATLMMGHGFDPALSEGALKPPIFLTSTFVFESAAAGKRFFEHITGKREGPAEGLVYSRFNGPDQEILEDRLSLWEEAEDALTFSSGMSAIATTLLALVQPGDVIIHSSPLYAATETLIGRILGRFGVQWVDFPAGASRQEIDAAFGRAKALGRIGCVYLESPANPTNQLVDIAAVAEARDAFHPDPLACPGPPRRGHHPCPPGFRRHRSADRPHPRPVRRAMGGFSGRRFQTGDRRRVRAGEGARSYRLRLSGKPGQPHQPACRHRRRCGSAGRLPPRPRKPAAGHHRQHLSGDALAEDA